MKYVQLLFNTYHSQSYIYIAELRGKKTKKHLILIYRMAKYSKVEIYGTIENTEDT